MMLMLLCQVHSMGVVTSLAKHLDSCFDIKVDLTLTCLREQKQRDGPSEKF